MADDLAAAILASAKRLGVDPVDLGTVVSYETAGTFDPWKAGPTTQWGQHRGLIQWGEPQRQKYGVSQGMPVGAQMEAAERYLTDAGVKPGMGLLDLYSAINAGGVGLYDRSDANNGGAPGTVRDKVEKQMGGHRQKAMALLGQRGGSPMASAGQTPMTLGAMPGAPSPAAAFGDVVAPQQPLGFGDVLARFSQQKQAKDEDRAADEQRRALLLGSIGQMYT